MSQEIHGRYCRFTTNFRCIKAAQVKIADIALQSLYALKTEISEADRKGWQALPLQTLRRAVQVLPF